MSNRARPTYGVIMGGVHLTYDSRSTANRVRRALRWLLRERPRSTREDIVRAAASAVRLHGSPATEIAERWLRSALRTSKRRSR